MKRSLVVGTAAAALVAAAVGWSIGAAAGGTPGEPARAQRPAAGRTSLPAATPYQICDPASAEPWRC